MASLISIGVSGLTASQTALTVTGNNITNANTPGYSRQRANMVTQPEQFTGSGYLGSGVTAQSITRVAERFAITQLRTNTANFAQADAMATGYEQLDSLLANSATGVAPALQTFFDSLQQASQDPTSIATRQVVLGSAGSLAQRFNTLYSQLMAQTLGTNDQLANLTGQVTSLAQNIASLNEDIAEQTGGSGHMPNELLDKRDELLRQLSEFVNVQVTESGNMTNVFIGSGQPLVVGTSYNTLGTAPDPLDPTHQQLIFTSGSASQDITRLVTGGKIGGLVQFRDESLDQALNTLGRIALTFADRMNEQQRLGLDIEGNFGNNIFADINSPVAQVNRVNLSSANTGTGTLGVSITDTADLTLSDYRLSFTSATDYELVRESDGATVTTGTLPVPVVYPIAITGEGFDINLTGGTFASGDRFLIQPTVTGAQDIGVAMRRPEELAFAQPISTDASLDNTGGGTISAGITLSTRDATGALQSTFANALTAPYDLTPPMLVRFTSATTYELLDNSDPDAPLAFVPPVTGTIVPGLDNEVTVTDPVSGDAVYSFVLSGYPDNGDRFTIGFNVNGSSDNRNAAALGALNLDRAIGGNVTFANSYGQLVSQVGSRTAELKINREAADTLLVQAQASRDSISGVNLDEEAANLIKFEQAYNASAQVINIARSIFDTLLTAFR